MQETQAGLHVKCLILFSILNKLGMCRQVTMELSSIRFHENPLCGFRVASSGVDKHNEGTRVVPEVPDLTYRWRLLFEKNEYGRKYQP
jgi:hypothetical protein